MVTRLIVVTILQCIEISNHCAMYQEVTCGRSLILCGRSLILQNEETNKLLEKENRFVVTCCKVETPLCVNLHTPHRGKGSLIPSVGC